jgi:hypothetical protein
MDMQMDTGGFAAAVAGADKLREHKGIGTLGEKTLHAVLKLYMEPQTGNHEVKIGPYVADIVGEHGIVEIQTRNFSQMRKKLEAFLSVANVTVVYPIPHKKWLLWLDPDTGELSRKRKSPKTGSFYHCFYELRKIRPLLTHPGLSILLLLIDMEEHRNLDGWSCDKKKGSTRRERFPLGLAAELRVGGADGYGALIPEGLSGEFSSKDYKRATGLSLYDAQTALNVLFHVGAVQRVGKKGNMYLYKERNVKGCSQAQTPCSNA